MNNSAPHSFSKGRHDGWHVPLVYVLTTNKNGETYKEIFAQLKRLEPNLNPTDVTVDFELAPMNAIHTFFELAEIHGCFFHFGQNIWRKVQEVGLQCEYSKNADFALNIRLLIALAFVPVESVADAFGQLCASEFYKENADSPHNTAIQTLLEYFQMTYIHRMERITLKKVNPIHPPHIWNVHDATLSGRFAALRIQFSLEFINEFYNCRSPSNK